MTPLDLRILRAVLDGKRGSDVTDEGRREHDTALVGLVERGLVQYNPARPAQRFSLTATGRAALDDADRKPESVFTGRVLPETLRRALGKRAMS